MLRTGALRSQMFCNITGTLNMQDFKVGDKVWIDLGCESDPFLGDVVAVLALPGWCHKNYVVAIETEMDPLLEVRAPHAITRYEEHP